MKKDSIKYLVKQRQNAFLKSFEPHEDSINLQCILHTKLPTRLMILEFDIPLGLINQTTQNS